MKMHHITSYRCKRKLSQTFEGVARYPSDSGLNVSYLPKVCTILTLIRRLFGNTHIDSPVYLGLIVQLGLSVIE